MLTEDAFEIFDRSLMLGTERQPAHLQGLGALIGPADGDALLKALSLSGQQKRFRRKTVPRRLIAAPATEDTRAILPATARPLLLRLLIGKNGDLADTAARAAADALGRRKMRLHPFDLPRLSGFVRENAAKLGTSARAWVAAAGTSEIKASFFEPDAIDENNWRQARPAERAAFIRRLRATLPAQARLLVAQAISGEQAAVRLQLLKALAEGISGEDRAFLESLSADRSQLVRDAAESLLSRVPGTPAAEKRLQDFLSRIKVSKAGILRRRQVLTLEIPANIGKHQEAIWAASAFAGVSLDALATALNLSVEELIDAAEDPVLQVVLAQRAAAARRFDLLASLVRRGASDAWQAMIASDSEDLDFADEATTAQWSRAATNPSQWQEFPPGQILARLYEFMRMPLVEDTAQALFGADAWRKFLGAAGNESAAAADILTAVAALTPQSQRRRLRQDLATLPQIHTARAVLALDLFDAIEVS